MIANAEDAGYKLLDRADLYSSEHGIGGIKMCIRDRQNTNLSNGTLKRNAKNSSFAYITMQFLSLIHILSFDAIRRLASARYWVASFF